MDSFSRMVLAHTSKATISWLKYNIGHYIPPGDWSPNCEICLWLKTFGALWLQLFMPAQSHRHWQHLNVIFKNPGDQFLWPVCKISSVQCLADWRQSPETKETQFCTNTGPLHCLQLTLSSCYYPIFGSCNITEYYNCCWAAICIIFSGNNFIDYIYRTISSLPVYEVYNIQVFAFKIVHDDVCHPICTTAFHYADNSGAETSEQEKQLK